ncbi:MAG: winged helix-turn-helix domain-containing protein [Lachnospiraceae bacterium]|nr:winged helix-turn-helix domain-containing protein [Lachnospiraceae bacterium]
MKQEYYVTMLGEFTISFKNKKIYDQSNRSKKPWNLIEYLMANRDRTVSQEELTDLLWDDSESDNPSGALKVLLHRARKSLEPVMPEDGEDLIVLKRGEYSWNRDVVTKVDTDEFELLCNRASDKKASKEERINLYSEALALYKGDFLPRNNEGWVIPISSYYHKIYMNAVRELIALYYEGQRYEEIINVCRKALTVEKLDESLYFDLINALYKSGQQAEALKQYSDSTDMFYKRFGITPSPELKSLYKTIVKTTKSIETDIGIIKEDLCEQGEAQGAFFCEYEFFKDVYQLEARACARSGDSIYLCLITLSSTTDEDAPLKVMNRAMEDLQFAINETLRRGDVLARYSMSQYVILLPTASYENVEMIMKRISSAFYRKYMKKDIGIQYKLQPLDPKM